MFRDASVFGRRAVSFDDERGGGPCRRISAAVHRAADIPLIVEGVFSADKQQQLEATQKFRQLLSIEDVPPIQQVIDAQVVPHFVQFLKRDDEPRLQFEAAWALTNIASGTHDQTLEVIKHDAVPLFVKLLSSPEAEVREQAVWALGNIAGDATQTRDLVLQCGGLQPLLTLLREEANFSMLRNGTWTLSNLCRGKPPPNFSQVENSLPTLAGLVYNADVEVLTDACWALSYLSDGPNERIEKVIASGVTRRLVDLLVHPSPMVQTPALRTIGNIVTGDDRQTDTVIKNGCIPNLLSLLSSTKRGIRKEACWTISNITAGNREQIQQVMDNQLVPSLVAILSEADFDIQKEAAWALSNAASGGNAKQVEYLVSCGFIKPMLSLLEVKDLEVKDLNFVFAALDALENILLTGSQKKESEGLEENPYCVEIKNENGLGILEKLLEKIQDYGDEQIYNKAMRIMTSYFAFELKDERQPRAGGGG
eukprot:Selendium_serpulae@DN5934_c0_g1_i4.p1